MRLVVLRAAAAIPVLLGLAVLTYALLALAPGDPVVARLGIEADPQAIAALRRAYALDQPLLLRFAAWLGHVVRGDFGRSIQTGQPVWALVTAAAGPSLALTATALAGALLLGVPLGVLAAVRPGGAVDAGISAAAVGALSLPGFWWGVLLVLGVSVRLRWLPASGFADFAAAPLAALRHVILPAMALGIGLTGSTIRVRTARAKGLPLARVVWLHALRPALAPVVALTGAELATLLGGVAVTETVFAWPGLGKLLADAISARDFPVVQGAVLLTGTAAVAINLTADLLAAALDPRARDSA